MGGDINTTEDNIKKRVNIIRMIIGGLMSVAAFISMIFGGYFYLQTEFASAADFRSFRASQIDSAIEGYRREERQLLREKRRVPKNERHYYDSDVTKIEIAVHGLEKTKQNVLDGKE